MKKADETQADGQVEVADETTVSISQWEFIERVPTRDDVIELLTGLGTCYGVRYVDYAEFVQALPSKKKAKRPVPNRPNVMADVDVEVFTLYMSVAGRIKMLADIAEAEEWSVEIEPEPFTPTQIPGMLEFGERIVYREYVTIKRLPMEPGAEPVLLGRRPGTAWVPATGGRQAARTNPFEKVETSARGRAIAAWGIGVLPGSGVASVEEMMGARENARQMDRQEFRQQAESDVGQDRPAMIEDVLTLSEKLRQERGISEEESFQRTSEYLSSRLGIADPTTPDGAGIDWSKVKTGQLVLYRNTLRQALQAIVDARSEV